jgi:hypothetical protein
MASQKKRKPERDKPFRTNMPVASAASQQSQRIKTSEHHHVEHNDSF